MPTEKKVVVTTDRRAEVKVRVTKESERLAGLPQHNYVPGGADLCMTCGQVQLHPLHGIDADALPVDLQRVAPLVGDPSYQKAAYTGSGCMVALFPGAVEKLGVEIQGGSDFPVEDQEDWHVTVAYMPETPEGDELQQLTELVNAIANVFSPLTGVWGGTARFNPSEGSDGKPVLVALPDLPALPELHHFVVSVLNAAGYETSKSHGYQPHMTIAYDDNGRVRAQGPLRFTALTLATKDQRYTFEFSGEGNAEKAMELAREIAAVKVKCVDCGAEYFADSQKDIDAHKATHTEQAKLSDADKASYEAETERIKESAKTDTAKGVHRFKAAKWTHPNGHPRCRVCGQEESISPECNREPTKAERQAFDDKLAREFGRPKRAVAMTEAEEKEYVEKTIPTLVREREETPESSDMTLPATRAFLTQVDGKTLITAPASTFRPAWEKALSPNQHMLWMQGRFVGAERANRNGAFWSTGDLEMGAATVNHGPLNWLHEAKHVIGTIADSKLIIPAEQAAEGADVPHIVAAAAIWRWIYPDEAYVVEAASDQNKLWYSMECVSREVACVGDGGCGAVVPYMEAITGGVNICTHIRERSATRRFVDPTFLGGAVIVPPVRPGWADADARVMREAAAMAEQAYEQAGQPDIAASEWEALMAQVIGYARG